MTVDIVFHVEYVLYVPSPSTGLLSDMTDNKESEQNPGNQDENLDMDIDDVVYDIDDADDTVDERDFGNTHQLEDEDAEEEEEASALNEPDGDEPDTETLPQTDDAEQTSFSRTSLHRKERHKRNALIAIVSVLGCLLAAYIGLSIFFVFHFQPNTVINAVDCSFKSVNEVSDIIEGQVDGYDLTIDEQGGGQEHIKGSDIGLAYVQDDKVLDLLKEQQAFAWPLAFFESASARTFHATVTYDEGALKEAVDGLKCMDASKMVAPVNAYPEYDSTKNAFIAHDEVLGTTVDTTVVYDAVGEAVADTRESIDLSDAGCYVTPTVTSTTQSLLDTIDTYNKYCCFSITYTFGNTTEVLDANTAISWFKTGSDGSFALDDGAIEAWVAGFASRHDTLGATRTFTSVTGKACTVTGGTYGWSVDQDAEVTAVETDIENHTVETREPQWATTAAVFGPQDWGTDYIELDLTNQHMYLIQGGKVTFESDVVTGLPTPAKQTPSGVYSILEMQSPSTLVGEIQADGQPEYRTTVAYWMRVTWSGVGFHDATWQSSFGGDRYTYAGSHGCINMPYSAAQKLYSMISVGLPVVSHY